MTPDDRRTALLLSLGTAVLYALLALGLFPATLQFAKYPRAAEQYLAGALPPERLLDFSPFYFYLHVVQGALLNGEVIVFLQIVVAAVTAAVLYLTLRRFCSPAVALLGAAAFVGSKSMMVYAAVLEPEPFLLLFLCAYLYFALGEGRWHPLYAGLALALALSVRPSVLPLLILTPIHYVVRDGRGLWRRSSALAVVPAVGLLILLSLRNGVATGEYTPLGMNPGFVFYEGNNPLSSGRSSVYPPVVGELKQEILEHPDNPHLTYRLIAERERGRELSTGEANRYWRGKAIAFVSDHPGRFVRLLGDKLHALVQEHRRHDLIPAQRYDERLGRIPGIPFTLLLACALAGAILTLPSWRRLLPVYGLFAGQSLLMILMYVSDRQRVALLPAVVFLAAVAAAPIRASSIGRRVGIATGILALTTLLLLPSDLSREDAHLWQASERAARARELAAGYRDEGRLADAREMAAFAYAAAPWMKDWTRPSRVPFGPGGIEAAALDVIGTREEDASLRFDRACLLLEAGRLDEAAGIFGALLADGRRFDRGYEQSSESRYYLARIAAARGRMDEARSLLDQALEAAPGDPFVLAELDAITGSPEYRERIVRYFSEADADFVIGLARLRRGADGAARTLARLVEDMPEFWRAQVYLVAALGQEGDLDLASQLYETASAERSDPAMLEDRVLPVLAAAASESPSARIRYGMALLRYGHLEEALVELRAATAVGPAPAAESAIAEIEELLRRSAATMPPAP